MSGVSLDAHVAPLADRLLISADQVQAYDGVPKRLNMFVRCKVGDRTCRLYFEEVTVDEEEVQQRRYLDFTAEQAKAKAAQAALEEERAKRLAAEGAVEALRQQHALQAAAVEQLAQHTQATLDKHAARQQQVEQQLDKHQDVLAQAMQQVEKLDAALTAAQQQCDRHIADKAALATQLEQLLSVAAAPSVVEPAVDSVVIADPSALSQ